MENIVVVCSFLLMVLFGVVLVWAQVYKPFQPDNVESDSEILSKSLLPFAENGDFVIENSLSKPICIRNEKNQNIVNRINQNSKRNFDSTLARNYFQKKRKLFIYVRHNQEWLLFAIEKLQGNVKSLHFGQITSKSVGPGNDSNFIPGLNAVQGRPWVRITNLTEIPLKLNTNITIPPNSTKMYNGRDGFGVRLGTVFSDVSSIFPSFVYTIPATDIYFGVNSENELNLYSGYSLSRKLYHNEFEPQYLLENGWMGGPAVGNIEHGFLPLENSENLEILDRWGEKV